MIFALALLQSVAPSPPPAADPDIVVIARKLQDWRASVRMKKGKYVCAVTRSTGDPEIDGVACEAMRVCAIPAMPRYTATRAKGVDAGTRQQLIEAINGEMATCVRDQRHQLIAELADRRAGAVQ